MAGSQLEREIPHKWASAKSSKLTEHKKRAARILLHSQRLSSRDWRLRISAEHGFRVFQRLTMNTSLEVFFKVKWKWAIMMSRAKNSRHSGEWVLRAGTIHFIAVLQLSHAAFGMQMRQADKFNAWRWLSRRKKKIFFQPKLMNAN